MFRVILRPSGDCPCIRQSNGAATAALAAADWAYCASYRALPTLAFAFFNFNELRRAYPINQAASSKTLTPPAMPAIYRFLRAVAALSAACCRRACSSAILASSVRTASSAPCARSIATFASDAATSASALASTAARLATSLSCSDALDLKTASSASRSSSSPRSLASIACR